MSTRKRQAAETLSPTHHRKQPRLALKGLEGHNPSPAQEEGILARWKRIGADFMMLATDTVTAIFSGLTITDSPPAPDDAATSPDDEPSRNLSDGESLSASSATSESVVEPVHPRPIRALPNQPTLPDLSFMSSSIPTPPPEPPVFISTPRHSQSKTPLANDKLFPTAFSTPTPGPRRHAPVSPPQRGDAGPAQSTSTISASTHSSSHGHTQQRHSTGSIFSNQLTVESLRGSMDAMKGDSRLTGSMRSSGSVASQRLNGRKREHIYNKAYKAGLHSKRKQIRENLARQIYEVKRQIGYTSDYADFKGLLDYQRKLSTIESENPVPLVASALDVSVSFSTPRRRIIEEEDDDSDFLHRVLENAKATLNSPRPPRPFVPSFDQLRISQRSRDDAIERRLRPKPKPLPASLPPTDEAAVNKLLATRGVISKVEREQVSDGDLARLKPQVWLNDELINFYGALIQTRSDAAKANKGKAKAKDGPQLLDVHCFSSFFWSKLLRDGYEKGRLSKWTKKVDIFSKDIVLIPANYHNAHWTAAAINFKEKRIESYDSMDSAKERVFTPLRAYVEAEHLNKKKKPFDWTGWVDWAPPPPQTPQQENGFDCGVFTCQFLESLSRGETQFRFSQKDMPYLRRRMIWEIGHAQLRDD